MMDCNHPDPERLPNLARRCPRCGLTVPDEEAEEKYRQNVLDTLRAIMCLLAAILGGLWGIGRLL